MGSYSMSIGGNTHRCQGGVVPHGGHGSRNLNIYGQAYLCQQPCQGCVKVEVFSIPKAQVAVGHPLDIKGIRRGKASFIPVGRNDPGADARLGRNALPSQRYLIRRLFSCRVYVYCHNLSSFKSSVVETTRAICNGTKVPVVMLLIACPRELASSWIPLHSMHQHAV